MRRFIVRAGWLLLLFGALTALIVQQVAAEPVDAPSGLSTALVDDGRDNGDGGDGGDGSDNVDNPLPITDLNGGGNSDNSDDNRD